jgi:hypothetical protein
MSTNAQIIKAAALGTADVTSGLLNPEQSAQFLKQVFEATTLGPLVRSELRRATTGQIDKIGIASRILRKKTEGIDANAAGGVPVTDPATGQVTGYRAKPTFSAVEYATTALRLPWEITNETIRQNIEGEGLEATVTNLMTKRMGVDTEDFCLNADSATDSGDPDYDFLKVNDGWVKQIAGGGHIYDATGAPLTIDVFYEMLKAIPNQYNSGSLRWLMSPFNRQTWEQSLLNQSIMNGGNVPETVYKSPGGIPIVEVPRMPDDKIILTDPRNLVKVFTYAVQIRKVDNDTYNVAQDKRSYFIHFDVDMVVEELDATAMATGVGVPAPEEPDTEA